MVLMSSLTSVFKEKKHILQVLKFMVFLSVSAYDSIEFLSSFIYFHS